MAVKIHLQKAYDRLYWEFIEDTLRKATFPEPFIKLTMFCVSSCSMQVLWNGNANGNTTSPFSPSR